MKSCETPPPPCAWIARSMTNVATSAAAVAHRVHQPGGLEDQQPRLLDLDPRLGDPALDHPVVDDRLPERGARSRALAHHLERALGHPDRAHRMVDAPGP